MSDVSLEDIVSLCKRRGFIYQGSEIYGGLAGTWDYGPLGVALKKNIMNLWWKMFVEDRDDMLGVDAAILMNQKVWQASGHTATFTDPLTEDVKTKKRYRVDHLLKDNGIDVTGMSLEDMAKTIIEKKIKSPDGNDLDYITQFNMMFKTFVGPTSTQEAEMPPTLIDPKTGEESAMFASDQVKVDNPELNQYETLAYNKIDISYLRPETAQGIFTNFKNVVDSFYPDVPFGIAQQGKAFRNEISPRDFVFRSREFEQMEIEYFVQPEKWEEAFEAWRGQVHEWCKALGLPDEKVHELEVPDADRAHYSKRTIDFEFDFPHGRDELLGMAYRTDFDLMNIQKASGKSMEYRPKDGGAPFVPHVIEPSFGVERAFMAVLVSAYAEDEIGGEKRNVLKLPKHLAPVKAAVSPLLKNKPELVAKAQEVYRLLKNPPANTGPQYLQGAVMYDDNGNIGKRYRRQDEIGTPECIVIDFQTLDDNTVTIRDRDTTNQTRMKIDDLKTKSGFIAWQK
jgi:glycyl-tRNA synthetase